MSLETIACPFCSCPVKVNNYGNGWVGICCHRVCYNSDLPPSMKYTENIEYTKKNGSKRFVHETHHGHENNRS